MPWSAYLARILLSPASLEIVQPVVGHPCAPHGRRRTGERFEVFLGWSAPARKRLPPPQNQAGDALVSFR